MIGSVGSRINLTRSPTPSRKLRSPARSAKSISRERLCDSIETLESEERSLFRYSSKSLSAESTNYGTVKQIREYRHETAGLVDFVNTSIDIICSTIGVKVLLLLLAGLPVSMVIVGSTYKSDCPAEHKLPLYLLVGGVFGLVKVLFLCFQHNQRLDYEHIDEESDTDGEAEDLVLSRFMRFTNCALSLFLATWFVFGNLWFYSIWKPNFEQPLHDPNNWCQPTLYWYTLYNLMASYVILCVMFIIVMAIVCYYIAH